jgi:nitrogen fixation protein FixH
MNPAAPPPAFVLTGWHVLAGFVLFFGADIAVNTVFMVSAYRTFPGETSVTPYEDGLAYNATLAQQKAQGALGWRMSVAVDGRRLRLEAFDRAGAPLRGLHVVARLQRPATEAGAQVVTFEEAAPGAYVAAPGARAGAWDADFTVHDAAGHAFLAQRRVVLP